MKKYFLFACVAAALVSCSSDEFLGENPELTQKTENDGAIHFSTLNSKMTRATKTGVEAANELGRQFYVFGVKKNSESKYDVVFNDYSVWYNGGQSTSNADGWEYVGTAATFEAQTDITRQTKVKGDDQLIKYWDYSAADYWFNAVSAANQAASSDPVTKESEKITWGTLDSNGQIPYVTVASVDENNTVFYANAVNREKANYAKDLASGQKDTAQPIHFDFKRLQSKIRLGFYETVSGYAINNVKFYPAAALGASTAVGFGTPSSADAVTLVTNATTTAESKLEAGFMPATDQTYKITYDYTDGKASLDNTTTSLVYSSSKSFGKLNYTVARNLDGASGNEYYMGETSNNPTWAVPTPNNNTTVAASSTYKGSAGYNYWVVLPNENKSAAFKIKVDYTLTSLDGSKETINVKGATAVVPAEYCKWMGNTAYTYLFKISDNSNGTTGDPDDPTDPAGLYPITFDACVVDAIDAAEGTTTEISNYAITTYQNGSVVDNGISYKAGEKIDVTILDNNGAAATTSSDNKVWYVYNGTEAKVAKTVPTLTNGKFSIASPAEGVYAISYQWKDSSSKVVTTTKYVTVGSTTITDATAIYDTKDDTSVSVTYVLPAGATFVGAYTEETCSTAAATTTDYTVAGNTYTAVNDIWVLYNFNQIQHKVKVTKP